MGRMDSLTDFNKLVAGLIETIKSLIAIEQDKLSAITKKDLEKLDACIKEEQVQVMKFKGLDKKREQLLVSLGYDGLSFSQIISTLDGSEKNETQKLFDLLKKCTKDFGTINSSVKTAIDINLHSVNKALDRLKKTQNGVVRPTDDRIANRLV
jgi:hypothetical protein